MDSTLEIVTWTLHLHVINCFAIYWTYILVYYIRIYTHTVELTTADGACHSHMEECDYNITW